MTEDNATPVNTPFLGVYMHRDGEIRIDRNASVDDLLKVIDGLISEMNWWKEEARWGWRI